MKEKNIALWVILSIVTCGIAGLIWFVEITNDAATANEDAQMNGGTALLLSIVTCGIYTIYWYYKMGKEIYEAQMKNNMNARDNSVLYLILGLVGLGIVSYCLIQSDLNELAQQA